jgi:hypothetical protein
MTECQNLLAILDTYEQAPCQNLNHEKTSLFFSTNTPPNIWRAIYTTLRTTSIGDLGKYLGLPPIVGCGKKTNFYGDRAKDCEEASRLAREIIITS